MYDRVQGGSTHFARSLQIESRVNVLQPVASPSFVQSRLKSRVRRAKGGQEATHPLLGNELRALRELKRQSASPFVFASERSGPFTPSGFAKLLARAEPEAKIGFKVHPHMLRHACGYELANKGIDTRTLQAYLGHRSINSTTRYAALAPGRFKNIWGKA
jgi:site-specific recombinase XerD